MEAEKLHFAYGASQKHIKSISFDLKFKELEDSQNYQIICVKNYDTIDSCVGVGWYYWYEKLNNTFKRSCFTSFMDGQVA